MRTRRARRPGKRKEFVPVEELVPWFEQGPTRTPHLPTVAHWAKCASMVVDRTEFRGPGSGCAPRF